MTIAATRNALKNAATIRLSCCGWVAAIFAWVLPAMVSADPGPTKLPREVLYYGREGKVPEQVPLRAGPLSMVFEGGDLRYIKLGDREIVRRWYAVTRDRNWGTLENRLSNLRLDARADSFQIRYDVENKQHDIDFVWTGEITGDRDGTITFRFDGEARTTFLRNRIGFCILHPSRECPGARCRAVHADGRTVESTFPRFISPDNPFQDLAGFAHEVLPGVWAELEYRGDTFEMEDQRNWVDASFKTFCTPLRIPYPVEVKQGTKVSQRVTLRIQGAPPDTTPPAAPDASRGVVFERVERQAPVPGQTDRGTGGVPLKNRLPSIGLGVSSTGQPLTPLQVRRLRSLGLSHLRVDLTLADPGHEAVLREITRQAAALGVPLEAAIHLSADAEQELKRLVQLLDDVKPTVRRWLVFRRGELSTTAPWIKLAREWLGRVDPAVRIGAGTNANFTELNRGRPPLDAVDAVCYAINPQVHAFDNRSLVETLEAHGATIASARQFVGGKPLVITPITLRPRFNPVATAPEPPPAPGELPSAVDVRQMSLFAAGWTLGSLKYVAESGGVDSVTYYETVGWRGVMEGDEGSPVPQKFRSLPGSVFPVYHVLADVAELAGGDVLTTRSSDTLRVDGLVIESNGHQRWIIANLTAEPQAVEVRGIRGPAVIRRLNETNAERAMTGPEEFRATRDEPLTLTSGAATLALMPFEISCLDVALGN